MMFTSPTIWLAIFTSSQLVQGYADFGTVTAPCNFEPIFTVPRPKFVPEDVYIRYEPYSSSITAVAPSLRLGRNGTHETSWSLHFVDQPTRTIRTAEIDLRRRGVFSGDPPTATCRPCDKNGNPIDNGTSGNNNSTDGSPRCSITNYDGVFRDGAPATPSLPSYCFNSGYTGALVPTPVPTDAGLPCCPVCYPPSTNGTNTSFTATTGVFNSPTTTPMTSGTTSKATPGSKPGTSTTSRTTPGAPGVTSRSTTPGSKPSNSSGSIPSSNASKETVTVTATQPVTITQITLSIETITPTAAPSTPVITTEFNTIIGCGTASGCGTVIGSGTVFLPPLGYPTVTSSGTVSGCAPKIIGCGTMIATSGIFTAPPGGPPATITACGEGTGSATLIGSGTVWPAGFNDMISFVSSGTLTGSGRVKGCGTITGYGTFTVSESYTATVTGTVATVNVYVSYCPGDLGIDSMGNRMRLAGNFSGDGTGSPDDLVNPHADEEDGDAYRYALSPTYPTSNVTSSLNATINSTSLANSLCRVCPEDSGICCPPSTDCGSDGHCPWVALEGSGYAMFGVNIVNSKNSSVSLGMSGSGIVADKMKAPGLPGSAGADVGGSVDGGVSDGDKVSGADNTANNDMDSPTAQKVKRRFKGYPKHKAEPRHEHEHGLAHHFGLAHFHRH